MKNAFLQFLSLILCLTLLPYAYAEDMLLAAPKYPQMAPYPSLVQSLTAPDDAYDAWRESINTQNRDSRYTNGLQPFLTESTRLILSGCNGTNRVYSPLSLYMALAMLAETTGGGTCAELLTLLGHEDVFQLRQQASDLWNANYRDDGAMTRTLATSLWLNETVSFRQTTVQTLADSYYASAYRGKMGSAALNTALQTWLNDNTLGLLTEQAQSIQLPPDTAAAIAATVALSAKWDKCFYEDRTSADVFHSPRGDITCDFMHRSGNDYIYWGERFTAACLPFDMSGEMWFILPDKGVTTDDLLADAEIQTLLSGSGKPANSRYVELHMSVPKFDISSQLELSDSLRALGVTEVFDAATADFTPLTESRLPISLSQVRHDARVTIDEDGCTAAAYTVMLLVGAAPPQDREVIDFTLDKPFLFVITGANDLPLFVGVVNLP
ncbi:MAG: hypothetical protein IJZ74_12020 [Clostridia bacterium]|nr:hypothetical protein [Clostridia bacterium]